VTVPIPPLEIAYAKDALAFLEGLPKKQRQQIVQKISRLATDPEPPGSKKLEGVQDGSDPVRRIRQGDYRMLYVVRPPTIVILDIDHRKDVYR
jgi:mRNA-degrading endonuclease RelE of RelBE toxin-antitoxin system